MRIVVAMLLLGGCGDDLLGGFDGVVSGSRLRARYLESGDTRIFRGFHDRQLETDCVFQYDDDSRATAHCLPEVVSSGWYLDAACTERIAVTWEGCGSPPRYAGAWADGCQSVYESIWELGEVVTPTRVFVNWSGECREDEIEPSATYRALGAAVPLDTFVEARLEIDGGSSRLRRVSYRASDGARATDRVYDVDRDVDCDLEQPGQDASTYRCLPIGGYSGDSFRDDDCSEPIGQASDDCEVSHVVDWDCDGNACAASVFTRGEEVTPAQIYYSFDGLSCQGQDPYDFYRYYRLGDAVALDDLAGVSRIVEDPAARVSQYAFQAADGFQSRTYGLFDTVAEQDCDLQPTDDGEWRCIPPREYEFDSSAFTDPSCTDAVRVAYRAYPEAPLQNTVAIYSPSDDACTSYATLHAIMPQPLSPLYLLGDDGVCAEWLVDPTTLHAVTDELSLDDFAAFHEVVE